MSEDTNARPPLSHLPSHPQPWGLLGSIAVGGLASAFGASAAMAVAAIAAGAAFVGLRLAFPGAFTSESPDGNASPVAMPGESPVPMAEGHGAIVRS